MLEGIVTEKRFQMSFEYSACRVANTLRAELHAAGLNRGEISCLEFVLLNRSATLTGGYRSNVDHWVETENERLQRKAAEGFLEAPAPITVLELGCAFLSLETKGMVEDGDGALRLPVIEMTRPSMWAP
jgi:hypothetical protein